MERRRPTAAIQIGKFKLTGASALLALVVLIAIPILIFRPAFGWSPLWISAALWIAFMVYWSASARSVAATKSAESPRSRQIHELMLNLSLLLLFIRVPGLKQRWVPAMLAVVIAGLLLQALSLGLMIWARRRLGRNWSGAITEKVDHELVRSGPYRILRHPIYTGLLGMYAGTALVSGELHALIAVVIAVIAYARKIPMEERHLDSVFGGAYAEYRKKSWALIPGIF